MRFLPALLLAITYPLAGQTPQVPHKMQFAGMTLTIRDDARKEIQKDVDALTQSPKHYNIKAERARTYFPIIEKVFEEEHLPDDFKFLVLQESALIPDAVSVSNAVGFWQFKDFTAIEMGLRVDKVIDERMNIVSSTRAAAGYIKKNNYFFNNWLYALQAYQMGAGGVMKVVDDSESGATHMNITSKTYWYVKKFLAHKIAFEDGTKGPGEIRISLYENKAKKTAEDWAKELEIDETQLREYNKWIRGKTIPDDKVYAVIKPVMNPDKEVNLSASSVGLTAMVASPSESMSKGVKGTRNTDKIKINGITAIKALPGDKASNMADRGNVDLSYFLKCNDISISDVMVPGEYYFLGKKRSRATENYHKVQSGEDLWKISQQYGVQMKKLRKYNRLESNTDIRQGMTLWLSATKPKNDKKTANDSEVIEIDTEETFGWAVASMEAIPMSKTEITDPKEDVVPSGTIVQPEESAVQKADTSSVAVAVPVEKAAPTQTKTEEKKIEIHADKHVVQAGETLYAISKKYNVGVMELVTWNDLDLKAGIRPGQVLKLVGEPLDAVENEETVAGPNEIIHEVKASDTLYSVARKYGVTINEVMEWNGKKDFSISLGERLRILQK